jgi:pyridoxamine 5'-phosphate oxidase
VRIEGRVSKVSAEETAEYFHARPRGSQLGAWASRQSTAIACAEDLAARAAALQVRFENQPVPVPDFWGGYRLAPRYVEFWQGRASRLHDRIAFTASNDDGWTRERLCP